MAFNLLFMSVFIFLARKYFIISFSTKISGMINNLSIRRIALEHSRLQTHQSFRPIESLVWYYEN